MTDAIGPAAAPSFELVAEVDTSGLKVAVVRAALELELFDHIHRGCTDLRSLAAATETAERGLWVLVRALLSLELLVRAADGSLACSPVSDAYLRSGARSGFGPILLSWLRNRDHLVDALRGTARPHNHADESAANLWQAYAAPDLVRWPDLVGPVTERFHERGVRVPQGGAVLDLGCGSALYSLILVRDVPGATVVAVDRPEVLEVTRALAESMGLASRLRCMPGDVRTFVAEDAAFDVALLINVAQYLTDHEFADVLVHTRKALRPNGLLHLTTAIVDDGSAGWTTNWSTAIEMFLSSPDVLLRDDPALRQLLTASGFDHIQTWLPNAYVASAR